MRPKTNVDSGLVSCTNAAPPSSPPPSPARSTYAARLLYLVTERFANIDLHPNKVGNAQMGHAFEELIRKFAEISNETAGEHFTPREVIRLMERPSERSVFPSGRRP